MVAKLGRQSIMSRYENGIQRLRKRDVVKQWQDEHFTEAYDWFCTRARDMDYGVDVLEHCIRHPTSEKPVSENFFAYLMEQEIEEFFEGINKSTRRRIVRLLIHGWIKGCVQAATLPENQKNLKDREEFINERGKIYGIPPIAPGQKITVP